MADKYLIRDEFTGEAAEREATVTSSGEFDAGRIPALDQNGKLSETVLPASAGSDVRSFRSAQSLTANDLVYIGDDNGQFSVFRSSGSFNGKAAVGFVKESVSAGEFVSVYFEGIVGGQSNLVPGSPVFLSDDLGKTIDFPLFGTGLLSQIVGTAITDTEYSFEPASSIRLA